MVTVLLKTTQTITKGENEMAKETTQTTGYVAGFIIPIVGLIAGISMVRTGYSFGWDVIMLSVLSVCFSAVFLI